MVVLSQIERRELARFEEALEADQRLANLSTLFARLPAGETGGGLSGSTRRSGGARASWLMVAGAGKATTMRIAGLVFCCAVGALAAGILAAAIPTEIVALLLAPLIALALIVALRGAAAAGCRAWHRRHAVSSSLNGDVTGR
jgi:hypothetical protein